MTTETSLPPGKISVLIATVYFLVLTGISLFSCFLCSRIVEGIIHPNKALFLNVVFTGLLNDLLFSVTVTGLFVLPALLIAWLNLRFMQRTIFFLNFLLVLVHVLLNVYFYKANVPLGADILGYSWKEIKTIVQASGGFSAGIVLCIIATPLLFFCLYRFLSRRITPSRFLIKRTFIFSALVVISHVVLAASSDDFHSEYAYYLSENKTSFFFNRLHEASFRPEYPDFFNDKSFYLPADISEAPEVENPDFPFLKKKSVRNTLEPFFMLGPKKPNIVLVIIESLGRSYSGRSAQLGSFTPFMDSLSEHSLVWDNALSSGGRTFAVLPALLGSLPFLEKGFMEELEQAPRANSLLKIAACHGYTCSFYYGSNAHFDYMDVFLETHGAGVKLDESTFGEGYTKLPPKGNGFSWGYSDKDLFRKYFSLADPGKARLDILLTVANHDPFLIPAQDVYMKKVEEKMKGITDENRLKRIRPYVQQLSCVWYTDDALRYLFKEYSRRPDFQNTIFILTGDHRMTEIPLGTQLERFHVPFFIYSPMLKRKARFKSVITHFDLTPSLLALLSAYGIRQPELVHWLGSPLDTSITFQNKRRTGLMRNKSELLEYIDEGYFLSGEKLYRLTEDLGMQETKDPMRQAQFTERLNYFKQKNSTALIKRTMGPDSVLSCP